MCKQRPLHRRNHSHGDCRDVLSGCFHVGHVPWRACKCSVSLNFFVIVTCATNDWLLQSAEEQQPPYPPPAFPQISQLPFSFVVEARELYFFTEPRTRCSTVRWSPFSSDPEFSPHALQFCSVCFLLSNAFRLRTPFPALRAKKAGRPRAYHRTKTSYIQAITTRASAKSPCENTSQIHLEEFFLGMERPQICELARLFQNG